jgi:hypothetical protein
MYTKKKERFYISDLVEDPAVSYPSYYILSDSMQKNELLHTALIALHRFDFVYYEQPKTYEDIFAMLHNGMFPIFKEKYIVGYFGNKMMYLEVNGWKSMPVTEEVFKLEAWLVC